MAVNRRRGTAYGLSDALLNVFPQPIVAQRDPTTLDRGQIGQIWVNNLTNDYFILTSIVSSVSLWSSVSNGAGIFASLQATAGDITADVGNIVATAGDVLVTAGNVVVSAGTITAAGNIETTAGDLIASGGAVFSEDGTGNLSSLENDTITAINDDAAVTSPVFQLQKSRNGAIIAAGDTIGVVAFDGWDGAVFHEAAFIQSVASGVPAAGRVAGDLEFFTAPDAVAAAIQRFVISPTGEVTINTPDSGVAFTIVGGGQRITAGDLNVTAGDVILAAGDVTVTLGAVTAETVYAAGDLGGVAGTTGVTNVVDNTQGAGALTIVSASANPGTNAGFVKIYIGATIAYLPYWTVIAP